MTNMVSAFPAHNNPMPLHRHGGWLDVMSELQVSYAADSYDLQGTGSVRSLPTFHPGVSFTIEIRKGAPTFVNSSKLICQGGIDCVGAVGDLVIARSDGDGVWRLFVLRAIGSAKAGANSDITALSNLTGGLTLPTYGVGMGLAGGSQVYDGGSGTTGPFIVLAAGSDFRVYTSNGSTMLAQITASASQLPAVPKIGATNLLMQMSRGANGYTKFWDGTGWCIIQWGSAALGADGAVTFPTAFPNNCRQVVASASGAPATTTLIAVTTSGYTTTKFDAYPRFTTGSTPSFTGGLTYIAIGD